MGLFGQFIALPEHVHEQHIYNMYSSLHTPRQRCIRTRAMGAPDMSTPIRYIHSLGRALSLHPVLFTLPTPPHSLTHQPCDTTARSLHRKGASTGECRTFASSVAFQLARPTRDSSTSTTTPLFCRLCGPAVFAK